MTTKQSPFDTEEGKIIVAALTDYAARTIGRERAIAAQLAISVPASIDCEADLLGALNGLLDAVRQNIDGVPPTADQIFAKAGNAAIAAIAKAEGC